MFISHNCAFTYLIKDINETDELKDVFKARRMFALNSYSLLLKEKILNNAQDILEWENITDKKQILNKVYNTMKLSLKEIKKIKIDIETNLIKAQQSEKI